MRSAERYLVISDIHANWEALTAVLKDCEGQYENIVCLGDLVGYGPDPNRVVDWAREVGIYSIRGNHDRTCVDLSGLEDFSPLAAEAAVWTNERLTADTVEYLRNLPQGPVALEEVSLVHGSPRDENEYLSAVGEAANAFPYVQASLTFFGHTHLQGAFEARKGRVRGCRPTEAEAHLSFEPDADYLINPGSVGQPRDLIPEAAYALFTPGTRRVTFRRVGYPIDVTQRKLRKAGLPEALAARLASGE